MAPVAREFGFALRLCALFGLVFGCSGESGGKHGGAKPELEGELCVDSSDACCCDEELAFSEPAAGGPACRIGYPGDLPDWTIELVTEAGSSVLPRLASASECGANGGWYPSSTAPMQVELCESTCAVRRNETTRLRILSGCPAAPC